MTPNRGHMSKRKLSSRATPFNSFRWNGAEKHGESASAFIDRPYRYSPPVQNAPGVAESRTVLALRCSADRPAGLVELLFSDLRMRAGRRRMQQPAPTGTFRPILKAQDADFPRTCACVP